MQYRTWETLFNVLAELHNQDSKYNITTPNKLNGAKAYSMVLIGAHRCSACAFKIMASRLMCHDSRYRVWLKSYRDVWEYDHV